MVGWKKNENRNIDDSMILGLCMWLVGQKDKVKKLEWVSIIVSFVFVFVFVVVFVFVIVHKDDK